MAREKRSDEWLDMRRKNFTLRERQLFVCLPAILGLLLFVTSTALASEAPQCKVSPQCHASIPVNVAPPTISGTAKTGQTLSASSGTWTNEPTGYSYRWERCNGEGGVCEVIDEGVDSSFELLPPHPKNEQTIRVQVRAENAAGRSEAAASAPTTVVARSWEYVREGPHVQASHWRLGSRGRFAPIIGRSLDLEIETSGLCFGEQPPELDYLYVAERRRATGWPFKSVVITPLVRYPAPMVVVGKVYPGEPQPACADLGFSISRRIKLKWPVRDVTLYDGSYRPLHRVPIFLGADG